MKKWGITLLVGLALMALPLGQAFAAATENWKIGHIRKSGSAIDKDIHKLIDEISKGTNNRIVFDVYSGNRLGDYSVVQERVSFGEVQIYAGPLATSIDKRLLLATTPYLVNSWSEAKNVYHQDSLLLNTLGSYLSEQNIKLLGGWPVYFGGIGTRKLPPGPGEPDIEKEMIIRVPPIRTFELTARELGYKPYPITWVYAKMGLKTGMVDGILGGGAEGYSSFKDSIKFYLPVRDHFEYWFVYMNSDSWNRLSEKEQTLFLNAVARMENERYRIAEEEEKKSLQYLQSHGIRVVDISEQEMAFIQKRVREKVWPLIRKEVGPDFDRIISNLGTGQ